MTSIHRHALVRHSALRMYTLVNDVASYPRRFAWCEDSAVLAESESRMRARLDLTFAGLRTSFTTENTLTPPTRIELALGSGPYREIRERHAEIFNTKNTKNRMGPEAMSTRVNRQSSHRSTAPMPMVKSTFMTISVTDSVMASFRAVTSLVTRVIRSPARRRLWNWRESCSPART